MILIGQYDSPFVRRVAHRAAALWLPFEHGRGRPSAMPTRSRRINPLRRVPTLVLDGGEALIESTAILDYLDELVGPEKAMIAERGDGAAAAIADLRAGQRARRQGGQPDLRAGAAQGAARALGRALPSRRSAACSTCWRRSARRSRRRTGSASASATPTSWWPARCALPARRIRRCCRRALSGADGARRALRGAAAVPGDRAAARSRRRGRAAHMLLLLWAKVARAPD